jgi:hypothetical protein
MIDSLSVSLLQEVFRREGRSLLQYVRDAFLWAKAEEQAALADINTMIAEEQAGAAEIARFLQKHHVPLPYVGPYPMNFADVNFC